jgi:hypothetical protein
MNSELWSELWVDLKISTRGYSVILTDIVVGDAGVFPVQTVQAKRLPGGHLGPWRKVPVDFGFGGHRPLLGACKITPAPADDRDGLAEGDHAYRLHIDVETPRDGIVARVIRIVTPCQLGHDPAEG